MCFSSNEIMTRFINESFRHGLTKDPFKVDSSKSELGLYRHYSFGRVLHPLRILRGDQVLVPNDVLFGHFYCLILYRFLFTNYCFASVK